MRLLYTLGLAFCLLFSLAGQQPPKKKPVLIREDAPPSEEAVPVIDPIQAEKSVQVGNFYLRKKNYKAAESRFRQAIQFLPKWPQPYERLVKALEKQKSYQDALDVCEQFMLTNPDSERLGHFEKLVKQLRKKL